MELIRPGTRIDFIGYRKYAYAFSGALIIISLISIFLWKGLNLGIDFSGGLEMQVAFKKTVQTEELRNALATIGFRDVRIQSITSTNTQGSEYLIRLQKVQSSPKENESTKIQNVLFSSFGKDKVDIRRAEVVGAEVSKDLKNKGFLSCCMRAFSSSPTSGGDSSSAFPLVRYYLFYMISRSRWASSR